MIARASFHSATGRGRDYENPALHEEREFAIAQVHGNATIVAVATVSPVLGIAFAAAFTTIGPVGDLGALITLVMGTFTIPVIVTYAIRHDKLRARVVAAEAELRK